jgi:dTDP-4-amino-4,6-dideoxygalactose transaminase
MKVPLLDLRPQHDPIQEEIIEALGAVVASQRFVLGEEVSRLEEGVASYCDAKFGVGVSSGTDALLVALMALGIGPGDEVITSTYSFFSTAGGIARLGAKPVFVDIDPVTYNIQPEGILDAVTQKTKAVIPVHLFGQCADMDPILRAAGQKQLSVIEDAAQAIGACYKDGRRAGAMGDLACLSFYPTKNLAALGDAGMVLTGNPELEDRVRVLRVHGGERKYHHRVIGGNFRLDALQAAALNVKLRYLDRWTAMRRRSAACYASLFEAARLGDEVEMLLPLSIYGPDHHVYNQYIVQVARRDRLREYLETRGIGSEVYYPVPLHLQKCFDYLGYRPGDFPVAERAAKETLALPIYPGLTEPQQTAVVEAIKDFYKSQYSKP